MTSHPRGATEIMRERSTVAPTSGTTPDTMTPSRMGDVTEDPSVTRVERARILRDVARCESEEAA